MHIKNIFEEGELLENSTIKDYLTVQNEGGRKVSRNVTPSKISKLEAENKALAKYAKYKETIKN